jgi:hypothetical protein
MTDDRAATWLDAAAVYTVAVKRALFCCALGIFMRAPFALDPSGTILQYGQPTRDLP